MEANSLPRLCRERSIAMVSIGKSNPGISVNYLSKQVVRKLIEKCQNDLPESLSDFYTTARDMDRRLVFVAGPTNSGKTYQALQRFKESGSGVYLCPLRLLALEVRDRLQAEGMLVSLITGELVELVPGANHVASTIEMLDFDRKVDIAIIDEVQMLGDAQRGSAWLQAVLGVPAREIWMLGAPEAIDVVRVLADYLREPIEIIRTNRLAPLRSLDKPTTLADVPAGSALIAFSRQRVLALAGELKSRYKRKSAVIYGGLSPEVRREQARMFREGEVDVLVATDAIGMGLNLPITSVVFTEITKHNGIERGFAPPGLIRQIAGRAGRYGFHDAGTVGATDAGALGRIFRAIESAPEDLSLPFLYGPSWPIVQVLSKHLGTEKMLPILTFFNEKLSLSYGDLFQSAVEEDRFIIARLLDCRQISLRERLRLLNAPVPMDRSVPDWTFGKMIGALESGSPARVGEIKDHRFQYANTNQASAEAAVKVLTLYCWLHYRFPALFPDLEQARREAEILNKSISKHLEKVDAKKCQDCGDGLPWDWPYPKCDECHFFR